MNKEKTKNLKGRKKEKKRNIFVKRTSGKKSGKNERGQPTNETRRNGSVRRVLSHHMGIQEGETTKTPLGCDGFKAHRP